MLQHTDAKVIDVALRYGYESQAAFTRAFKSLHGVTPAAACDAGVSLKVYPRMTFKISIRGDVEMEYRIMDRPAFEMFGVVGQINGWEDPFEAVPAFNRKCDEDGSVDEMNALLGRFHDTFLHAAYLRPAVYDFAKEGFRYMICYYLPKGLEIPEKFERLSVPALTWAVFKVPLPNCTMKEFRSRIWGEWFPTSGYERAEGPDFEMYYGQAAHEDGVAEVWIPVQKK